MSRLAESAIEDFAIKLIGSEMRMELKPDTQGSTYNRANVAE